MHLLVCVFLLVNLPKKKIKSNLNYRVFSGRQRTFMLCPLGKAVVALALLPLGNALWGSRRVSCGGRSDKCPCFYLRNAGGYEAAVAEGSRASVLLPSGKNKPAPEETRPCREAECISRAVAGTMSDPSKAGL